MEKRQATDGHVEKLKRTSQRQIDSHSLADLWDSHRSQAENADSPVRIGTVLIRRR